MRLKDRELPRLLLFLLAVVQAKDCLVHDPSEVEDGLDFVRDRYSLILILQCHGNFSFEQSLFFCPLFSFTALVSQKPSQKSSKKTVPGRFGDCISEANVLCCTSSYRGEVHYE